MASAEENGDLDVTAALVATDEEEEETIPPPAKQESNDSTTSVSADSNGDVLPTGVDDATTSTHYDNDDDDDVQSNPLPDEDEEEDEDEVPLLKYARIQGASTTIVPTNHPTALSAALLGANGTTVTTTSAQLGRIRLPRGTEDSSLAVASPESSSIGPVLLTGHDDGSVRFVHMETGDAIVESRQMQVMENTNSYRIKKEDKAIIDVSLDASANYLTAINGAGTCAIWEVKYGTSAYNAALEPTSSPNSPAVTTGPPQPAAESNPFANFLTSLAGQPVPMTSSNRNLSTDSAASSSYAQTKTTIQVSRIQYPSSSFGGGRPTCMVMDPSYKRRREKAILVGFSNGRLVLTKRSFFLQRRSDVVIYQGSTTAMEAVTWRGALVAWADASGIKLFDVESMSRIAHVDRPTGARPSLYPTISSLRPSLCFETSDKLLVAWGDCVMAMHITEIRAGGQQHSATTDAAATTSTAPTEMGSATVVKRRQLECTMAWELDCVACGVAPLDKDHLVVLGLIPNADDEVSRSDDGTNPGIVNDVELQIISRSLGSVTYADAIPVNRPPSSQPPPVLGEVPYIVQDPASAYRLLSSFSIPRMEDPVEAEEEGLTPEQQDFDFSLFASDANTNVKFTDSHLRWSLDAVEFDASRTKEEEDDEKEDDDSDDYGFVVRESSNSEQSGNDVNIANVGSAMAPIMMVGAPVDLVSVRTRDVDDAVSHALALNKVGLALQRALHHKRQLRKHDMDDLIDAFLRTVLCIGGGEENTDSEPEKLSIRRLELAAKSTPVLLGGSIQRWEQWVNEFARIPGALFVLWDQLPVRDPRLPPELYREVLNSLFTEIEAMLAPADGDDAARPSTDVIHLAVEGFVGALSAWGPTHALREKISFQRYFIEQQKKKIESAGVGSNDALAKVESALQRRLTQSATSYLELPSSNASAPAYTTQFIQTSYDPTTNGSTIVDSSSDSLFPIDELASTVSMRLSMFSGSQSKDLSEHQINSEVALAALAELKIMSTNYKMALRCYLVIASKFSMNSLDSLEQMAVHYVNDLESEEVESRATCPYDFVIAMVEHHHLHGDLLEPDLLSGESGEEDLAPPLILLIRLLGLELVGDFLVAHCVPPPGRAHYGSTASGASSVDSAGSDISRSTRDGDETLPINYVAEQFRSSPPLLHWYLHLIFKRKPEMYVQFPTTAVPPRAVTELHRIHLELYIDLAQDRDSSLSLQGTEVYNQERKTTPLLLFLKAALPLGGIKADDARRLLESKRSGSNEDVSEFPHSFAIELAFVIENYGNGSEEESQHVLDLYLRGAKSVMLAASYAQRNTEHASLLWETLIHYCLSGGHPGDVEGLQEQAIDGTLFGSLLEAAALCGADLALLVASIPPGMNIEGLRPRLVAAVGDYRMKLTMHQAAADTCAKDRIALLRELGHRSRRGMPHTASSKQMGLQPARSEPNIESVTRAAVANVSVPVVLPRTVQRPNRHRLSVQLPMR